MARKPKTKAMKSRKPAPAKRKKAVRPVSANGHARLAKVALAALGLAVIVVAALVVFAPKPDPFVPTVARIAAPKAPPKQVVPATIQPTAPSVVRPSSPPQIAAAPRPPVPVWQENAVELAAVTSQPMIAIVIDDMGLDRNRSHQTVGLKGPLTLAYLAYAGDLATQTKAARSAGHELLVHVPMEPGSSTTDPGPHALLTSLTPAELARRIDWNLAQFTGYVGINNHMGSKATSDRAAMRAVMAKLEARGLLFLDSRTSGETVAHEEATKAGIPALRRDVFIDHDPSPIAVRAALLDVETVARRQGYAIAIGHPKDATINALSEWLPDVVARGFAIVPVSAIAMKLQPR
ncbi:MAG: divergent polysaccharide deacetylase family protein [Alphaproteobacteria bacterium]|nr:divergent polysaccharide deacetylase family protein [Alphaproteobacteria bacterium]